VKSLTTKNIVGGGDIPYTTLCHSQYVQIGKVINSIQGRQKKVLVCCFFSLPENIWYNRAAGKTNKLSISVAHKRKNTAKIKFLPF